MTPEKQGSFDGLCGIYALINACHAAIPQLGEDKREKLFQLAIEYLDGRGWLKNTILEGIKAKTLITLIKLFNVYSIKNFGYEIRYEKIAQDAGNIRGILSSIDTWLADNERCFVIIGITGRCDHWTCVSRLCDNSLTIVDSDDLKRLNFSRLTSGDPYAERDVSIDKDEVFGIWAVKRFE